jgi:hypothetical protein
MANIEESADNALRACTSCTNREKPAARRSP